VPGGGADPCCLGGVVAVVPRGSEPALIEAFQERRRGSARCDDGQGDDGVQDVGLVGGVAGAGLDHLVQQHGQVGGGRVGTGLLAVPHHAPLVMIRVLVLVGVEPVRVVGGESARAQVDDHQLPVPAARRWSSSASMALRWVRIGTRTGEPGNEKARLTSRSRRAR
jgi:hypothetical protein